MIAAGAVALGDAPTSMIVAKDDGSVVYARVTIVEQPLAVDQTSWGSIKSIYR